MLNPPTEPVIEDVGVSTSMFIRTRYRGWLIGLLLATLIYETFVLSWIFSSGGNINIFFAFLPLGAFGAAYAIVRSKVQREFMQQFAAAEGYAYAKDGELEGRDGFIFGIGHSKTISNFLTGQEGSMPVHLFNYAYTVGHGKESHTYAFTIYEIEFPNVLPAMILHEKGRNFGEALWDLSGKKTVVSLEGDFGKFFNLKVEKGLEIEALEIFTPDLMLKLRDEWKNFSLEFVNRHLYVYEDKVIGSRAELLAMRDFASYLIGRLKNPTARMANEIGYPH